MNTSAGAHLKRLLVPLGYVSALNKGKNGPEHPHSKQAKEACAEIENLWAAVKRLATKARAR
jgi:hypothetical protein